MTIVSEHRCWRCGETLPASAFGRNARRRSGLSDECRPCKRAADATRYQAKRPEILAKQRHKRATDPELRASRTAHGVAWRADPEHRERTKQQVAAWKAANPERWAHIQKAASIRREGRKKGAPTSPFTAAQLANRMAYFGNACWMCGGAFDHIDHVKPLSKGGSHMLANLRPACADCNQWKYNKWDGPTGLAGYIAVRRASFPN